MVVMFSIPVHEKPEVILDQILNYKYFNPECKIVLHFSIDFNWKSDYMEELEFWNTLNGLDYVYVNQKRLRTGCCDIIQTHISNYKYVYDFVEFDYFALSASNDLFIKRGLGELFNGWDIGIDVRRIELTTDWFQGKSALYDSALRSILDELNTDEIYGSQIEGSFYSKNSFKKIVAIIERHYDYLELKYLYAREEIYFSTIAKCIVSDERIYKDVFTYIPWHKELAIYIEDIKLLLDSGNKFCIKRVNREFDDYVRSYIREHIGNFYGNKKKNSPNISYGDKYKNYSFIFNIEESLCLRKNKNERFEDLVQSEDMVNKLKYYKMNGASIILISTLNVNISQDIDEKITVADWLKKYDIPYDQLIFENSGIGHGIFYVDSRSIRPSEFLGYDVKKLEELCEI